MKALLFTQIYPSLREPARGPYNHNIFRAISQRGETRVISPQPWWSRLRRPGELLRTPRESQTGMETFLPAYWSAPRLTALHARALYTSVRPLVARLRREFPFDAILAAWAYPDAVAASLLARDFDCPLVVKVLGSDINAVPHNPRLRRQIQQGLGRAARVVAVSEALRDRLVDLGIAPERIVVQHNGVDGQRFSLRDRGAVREQLGVPTERPMICCVGRLSHEKGVDVLLEAMGRLAAAGRRDVDLRLIGGGDEEAALRARVGQLGIEQQVHFHGMRPHDEIPAWISASDVLCLPSRREGCPNVVLEALASGRPVVASRVGGVPELIHGDNGLLVPSEDPGALADALQTALAGTWDPQALRDSVEFLSWDDVGAMYHDTLATALEEHRAGRPAPLHAPAGRRTS